MLFALFESGLFPENFFSEDRFNPALVRNKPMTVGCMVGARFNMVELREYKLYFENNCYSIALFSMGSELYRENELSGSLSIKIYELFSAGFSVHALNCRINSVSNRYNYCLRAGGAVWLGSLSLSGWINNINQGRFSVVDRLPTTYSLRADYAPENNIIFGLALRSIGGHLPFYNTGIKARMFKSIEIGLGLNTDPVLLEYTGCFSVGRLKVIYQGNSHADLGSSHLFGAVFRL